MNQSFPDELNFRFENLTSHTSNGNSLVDENAQNQEEDLCKCVF